MKTTVYGQLTLSDKEIITITDLKKTFEKEISENNFNDLNDEMDYNKRNDISKINIVTSYKNLLKEEKNFDGFIYIKKNSYLICTNSNNINLRYDNIYNTFIGNVSFNNYDNTLLNNNNFPSSNNNPSLLHNNYINNNTNLDNDMGGRIYGGIQAYNENLVKFKKKKFYQELDFLKDESNFENLKTNRYDLTQTLTNDVNNINNPNVISNNTNLNTNMNLNNQIVDTNIENNNIIQPNTRGEEVLILNEPINANPPDPNAKKKRGRRKKIPDAGITHNNLNANNNPLNPNINNSVNNNINNTNVISEPIQIANDDDNEEMNSVVSENNNDIHQTIINNNPIISSVTNINTNNDNQNDIINNTPVNLDEITEDYSDTLSENSQERANLQKKNNKDNNNEENAENQDQAMIVQNEDNNNSNKETNNNEINNSSNGAQNGDNNASGKKQNIANPKDTEQIEKLINDSKFESSRDRLFKIYNYLLSKGFVERTRKLFVKCLLNYGFPLVNEFDKFYILFQMNAQHLKIKNVPNKIDTQLYYELVYFILEEDEYLDYNIFVFGEERTSIIRTKLLIIRQFQSFKDVTKAMYFFVKDRPGVLFGHIEPKLDENYQRVQFVMAKLLSNLVSKSIKSGFLNYKNYIKDDNIIFDNIRIKKDGQTSQFNIREGIAKKIFGKAMNENEFNNVITMYYEALFVQILKVPENIMNNTDSVMR